MKQKILILSTKVFFFLYFCLRQKDNSIHFSAHHLLWIVSVISNIASQHDYTWNQLKHKPQCILERSFFIRLLGAGRPTQIVSHNLVYLVTAQINKHGKENFAFFDCLPSFSLATSSIQLLSYLSSYIRTSLSLRWSLKVSSIQRLLRACRIRVVLLKHSALWATNGF